MKRSELEKQIHEIIIELLSEAGEKTAMVTTKSGETTAIDYEKEDQLKKIGDNTDVTAVKTGDGRQIKKK